MESCELGNVLRLDVWSQQAGDRKIIAASVQLRAARGGQLHGFLQGLLKVVARL